MMTVTDAVYQVAHQDTMAVITAQSGRYPGSTITAQVNAKGAFLHWDFKGCFE